MTHEQYLESEGQTDEEYEADLDRRVRDAITAQFVLDEIAQKEQMGVSEQELTQHLVRRAQQSGVSPDEYAKHAMEHDHISALVSEVVRGKALAHVVEQSIVTDESGNTVELANLQPDGTYADPDDAAPEAAAGADAIGVTSPDAAEFIVEDVPETETDAETDRGRSRRRRGRRVRGRQGVTSGHLRPHAGPAGRTGGTAWAGSPARGRDRVPGLPAG